MSLLALPKREITVDLKLQTVFKLTFKLKNWRGKGVAILLSSDGKTWKLLNEINDWSIRPFTKEPKKNHIQWRECNTESYQRSKPSSLSNKRQPPLLWTFESLTHSNFSSQKLFYCIYHYTTKIKINVKSRSPSNGASISIHFLSQPFPE